jgi:hypothetical protein
MFREYSLPVPSTSTRNRCMIGRDHLQDVADFAQPACAKLSGAAQPDGVGESRACAGD